MSKLMGHWVYESIGRYARKSPRRVAEAESPDHLDHLADAVAAVLRNPSFSIDEKKAKALRLIGLMEEGDGAAEDTHGMSEEIPEPASESYWPHRASGKLTLESFLVQMSTPTKAKPAPSRRPAPFKFPPLTLAAFIAATRS